MEENEELPVGDKFIVIRDDKKDLSRKSGTKTSQANIRTQMVGARRAKQSNKPGRKPRNTKLDSETNKKNTSNILRIIIILLCAAAVYLYLSDQ